MIISALLDLIYSVFSLLTLPISIPSLPSAVSGFIDTAFTYIESGIGLLQAWFDIKYLLSLFQIVVAVDFGILSYKCIMYVLRKIPFFGIN